MIFLNFYPCLSESSVVKKRSIRCANGAVAWGQRVAGGGWRVAGNLTELQKSCKIKSFL
jgi:hypothetical protein